MGGPRNKRTAGGGVLQPQGVINAGGAAPGALPSLSPGPRRGGGFFMAAVGPVRSFYPWGNFEATICENTHDNQQEQAYYR